MPPRATSKKLVPKERSIISSTSAIVMAGNDRMIRNAVKSVIQVNTGRRIIVSPEAAHVDDGHNEIQRTDHTDETPKICSPITQRSVEESCAN